MLTKECLRKDFAGKWKEHYETRLFRERGFVRKVCPTCGTGFWTLDHGRENCGDASCSPYEFIGRRMTRRPWNYVSMWQLFEQFFKKEGHTPIKRYPVIDRVRPDLYFTIASIQDFQRIENGKMIFVYPANPLIVPQMCLRFSDIDSVGVSGRHLTSFMMPGQHAFGFPKTGYFKDRCMELGFDFLTKDMGVRPEEVIYKEDLWAMPDFSAFGPSMEAIVGGLEVATHVFMQFTRSGDGFRQLDTMVNDTGWGHERLIWLSNATETMYDCMFGPALELLHRETGIKPSGTFARYARFAGLLDMGELKSVQKAREKVAAEIGITPQEMAREIEPLQALYAIADHTRTLLFAITDGGIPSNVGGGYNLRVILRRCLSFMRRHSISIDLMKVMESHAAFLKPLYPELSTELKSVHEILEAETARYRKTVEEARKIVTTMKEKRQAFDEKTLVSLYESNGITPDMVRESAGVDVPEGIYASLTRKHESREAKQEAETMDVAPTRPLFYEKPAEGNFTAKVVWTKPGQIALDRTLFFPEVGGQDCDTGTLNGKRVTAVSKVGGVIIHHVKGAFKKGTSVAGAVNMERRRRLTAHHTAIHIINGSARKVLGDHVWQAGASKTTEKATLDITHFKNITDGEASEMESMANSVIKRDVKLEKAFYERPEAEARFGLRIYQGGVIPESRIRVIEIPGVDVEACSGIHAERTGELGIIIITGVERIQDGVARITLKAGKAAEMHLQGHKRLINALLDYVDTLPFIKVTPELRKRMDDAAFSRSEIVKAAKVFEVAPDKLPETLARFAKQINEDRKQLDVLEKRAGVAKSTIAAIEERHSLEEIAEHVFWLWKDQRKCMESLSVRASKSEALRLLAKAKQGRLFEIIPGTRDELISTSKSLLETGMVHTVVLANESGDIIGMSRQEDMATLIQELCKKAGGAGGGRKDFAQGKAQLSALMKIKVF